MKLNLRALVAGFVLVAGIWVLGARSDAVGDKDPWKPILPKEIYDELAKREADIIRERLNGKADNDAIVRAKVAAIMIAAFAKSIKEGPEPKDARAVALELAITLNKKGELAAAKKLAALLPSPKQFGGGAKMSNDWNEYLELVELMDHLRPKDKGGDGMHPDLQSNIRLKGALNSIEEKIRALAMKELTPTSMKKEAKELEMFGYRTAVIGSLTYYYAPPTKVGKKDPQEWRVLSLLTRDQSVGLAVAAKKGDTAALFKVSSDLNSTCTQCHTVFR